jgi:triacylglycerol lipase
MIGTRRRQWLAFVATAVAATATSLVSPTGASATLAHDPIVFVHGYTGSASNWDTMVGRFKSDGWTDAELTRKTYSSSDSNKAVAQAVAAEVDRVLGATGASKVDIVTHSMGGLSSRYYVKYLASTGKVDEWVSLGGPNHGTTWAYGCASIPCLEMRPGSSFLTELNAGDETPGAVNHGTWWSPCDEIIDPDDSTALSGAKNTKTACIAHNGLLTDSTVYAQVRDFVR